MIFGNKSDFAIESIIEPHLIAPSHPWGRLCIWVDGYSIGDIEEIHCGLYPIYDNFQKICNNLKDLWKCEFKGLSDLELWNFLDGLLYSYHGNKELENSRTLRELESDWEKFGKFNFLTNWGEMFDLKGKSFILFPPNMKVKILNYDYEKDYVNTYECTEIGFRLAIKEFRFWYERQMELLDSKNV